MFKSIFRFFFKKAGFQKIELLFGVEAIYPPTRTEQTRANRI